MFKNFGHYNHRVNSPNDFPGYPKFDKNLKKMIEYKAVFEKTQPAYMYSTIIIVWNVTLISNCVKSKEH